MDCSEEYRQARHNGRKLNVDDSTQRSLPKYSTSSKPVTSQHATSQHATNQHATSQHTTSQHTTSQHTTSQPATCQQAVTPGKRDLSSRVKTFVNVWPNHTETSPLQIAKAGFFCLGSPAGVRGQAPDRVKCWWCNGGLQWWERTDDPWVEHAKWYPTCEFLLKEKGSEFIRQVTNQFPDIDRPALPQRYDVTTRCDDVTVPPSLASAMQSEVWKEASKFGFDANSLEAVVERKLSKELHMYDSVQALVADVQQWEEQRGGQREEQWEEQLGEQREEQSASQDRVNAQKAASSSNQFKPVSAGEILMTQQPGLLEFSDPDDRKLCKVCLDDVTDCVLMTCGHVCCCVNCASALRHCPICRARIEKIVKFYTK